MNKFKKSPYLYEYTTEKGDFICVNSFSNLYLKIRKEEKHDFDEVLANPKESELNTLLEKGLLVSSDFDIEKENEKILEEYLEKKDKLHLIILPTEGCNFRCKYCYENHKPQKMSKDTEAALLQFVREKLPKYKGLFIDWFGGEPLLEKEMINRLSYGLRSVCRELKKPFCAAMTTNGYTLDRDTFKTMFSNRVTDYQITLDGPSITHDKYRPFVNGKGTFDVILENLKRIRDEEKSQFIRVIIRCNITASVLNVFDEYVDVIEKEFGNDKRFGVLWKIAWNPTPEKESDDYCKAETLDVLLKKYQGRKIIFPSIFSQYSKYGKVCYAGKPNSFVIRSDGVISKCTVDFDNEKNNLGNLKNVLNVGINQEKMDYWSKHDFLPLCKNCLLFPSCLGIHCPKKKRDEKGERICFHSFDEDKIYFEYMANNKDCYMEWNDLWK